MLSPKLTQHLAHRFGLTYADARASRLLPELVECERRISALASVIRAQRARVRAYRRARSTDLAHRLDWLTREAVAVVARQRASAKRDRLQSEADKLKGRIVRKLFVDGG